MSGEHPTSILTNGISMSVEKHVSRQYDNLIVNSSAADYDYGDEGDCSSVIFGKSITSLFARYNFPMA